MKIIKLFLFIGCMFLGCQLSIAQESNLETIAKERIVKLNTQSKLNLSQDQESKMYTTFLTREKKMKSLKNANLSKKELGSKIAEIDIEFINNLQKILNETQLKKLIRTDESLGIQ